MLPRLWIGPLATDQRFHDKSTTKLDQLLRKRGILTIAMEGSGFAQACWLFHTPFLILRMVSDNPVIGVVYTQTRAKKAAEIAAKSIIAVLD